MTVQRWLVFDPVSTATPTLFSRAAPQSVIVQLNWHMGSPHLQCNTLCFLLSFLSILLARSPSFSRSFWTEPA